MIQFTSWATPSSQTHTHIHIYIYIYIYIMQKHIYIDPCFSRLPKLGNKSPRSTLPGMVKSCASYGSASMSRVVAWFMVHGTMCSWLGITEDTHTVYYTYIYIYVYMYRYIYIYMYIYIYVYYICTYCIYIYMSFSEDVFIRCEILGPHQNRREFVHFINVRVSFECNNPPFGIGET